jgi:hypothetical protein
MNETVEVDRDYLWALEVLALDYLQDKADHDDYQNAKRVVEAANLNQPRPRRTNEKSSLLTGGERVSKGRQRGER